MVTSVNFPAGVGCTRVPDLMRRVNCEVFGGIRAPTRSPDRRSRSEVVATRAEPWPQCRSLEWARRLGALSPKPMTASWFGSARFDRIQGCGAEGARQDGLPRIHSCHLAAGDSSRTRRRRTEETRAFATAPRGAAKGFVASLPRYARPCTAPRGAVRILCFERKHQCSNHAVLKSSSSEGLDWAHTRVRRKLPR